MSFQEGFQEELQQAIKELTQRLTQGLQVKDNSNTLRDVLSIYLLPHVIYKNVEDEEIKCELNRAYRKLIDDCKLLDLSVPSILIECINDGKYKKMMPPVLREYWGNFLQTIEYFINPSPDIEAHIDPKIINQAEFNAKQLYQAAMHYGQDL